MIRRTPLKRSTKPIARRTRVKAKRAKPHRGPMRDPGYLAFLCSECKCVVCLAIVKSHTVLTTRAVQDGLAAILKPCDPAHGPVNGMRSKGPDNEALPLCRYPHHEEQTRIGHDAFAAKYGLDWQREAAAHYALYLIWKETTGVIE